ncbi:MAG: acyl-CoA thioesterase [Anaerolineales bacterium]|nr:acyl-CoA thioesterase [Anaerolineales bacterium]MDW8278225.1 acyl-CoA thioesterase [Anaerolineales bacterium]
MNSSAPKPMRASQVSLAQLMQPEHANPLGNVHGGWIMKLVDECGALAAMRHARKRAVTVAIDRMTFRQPIKVGDLVTLTAHVTYTGRTSIEVEVQVEAENPVTGERTHTNTAYLVYVALDEAGNPAPVPPVLAETPEEQAKLEAGRQRQKQRLEQKQA